MSVIILGSDGQLGSELIHLLPDAIGLSRQQLDITNPDAITQVLEPLQPHRIINCAAYNQVDLAEDETSAAWPINAMGPLDLARFSKNNHCQLIHIGTDFVFGLDQRRRTPYSESDLPGPVSAYGTSKLAGEQFVLATSPAHLVIRTCGLYGAGGKGNFVKTMLRLASRGKPLSVVDDQTCSPTSIKDLAAGILAMIEFQAQGLFHFVNKGKMTWYEFASKIFEIAKIDAVLKPINSVDFGAAAARPAYSVLNCEKYKELTGQQIRSIEDALQCYLENELS